VFDIEWKLDGSLKLALGGGGGRLSVSLPPSEISITSSLLPLRLFLVVAFEVVVVFLRLGGMTDNHGGRADRRQFIYCSQQTTSVGIMTVAT
jgi:hypothetical protein